MMMARETSILVVVPKKALLSTAQKNTSDHVYKEMRNVFQTIVRLPSIFNNELLLFLSLSFYKVVIKVLINSTFPRFAFSRFTTSIVCESR